MKIIQQLLCLYIILILMGCLSQRRSEISEEGVGCILKEADAIYSADCISLRWICRGDSEGRFRIIRDSTVDNGALRAEFETDKEEYTDCSILPGITYTYKILSTESGDASEEISVSTPPNRDFDYIISSEQIAGKKLEFDLVFKPSVPNPYDYSQIDISATIIRPDGIGEDVSGFFSTDYKIEKGEDGKEIFIKGEERIKIRYLPDTGGTYIIKFFIKEKGLKISSGYFPIVVSPAESAGYVKVSHRNPYYFESNGKWFFPVGFNIGWARYGGLFEFKDYINKMQKSGANFMRMWMIKWSNAIEWTDGKGNGAYNGLVRYAQDNASRIDRILSYAEENGIRIMLTLGSYLEFTEGGHWNEGAWSENPYNIVNGGPCSSPQEFFESEDAKKIYKNRLRYIAARWGYSPSIFAYEFFNETNAPFEWVSEMSIFLKRVDNNRHMISTTYGDEKVFNLKNIDFTMTHLYGNPPDLIKDYPERVSQIVEQFISKYKKPFLLAEFGIDWSRSDYEYDRDGKAINFHNGIFASLTSGAAGTAMLWWWDDYIDRLNLFKVLSPVATIIEEFGDFGNVKPVSYLNIQSSNERLGSYGLSSAHSIILWIYNRDSNWHNAYYGITFEPVSGDISVLNLPINCKGISKEIDPWSGEIIREVSTDIMGEFNYSVTKLTSDIIVITHCNQ